MNGTVSHPSLPHCSASNPGCTLSSESSHLPSTPPNPHTPPSPPLSETLSPVCAAVSVPVGGDWRRGGGGWTGLSGLLRQTCKRTNLVVAGWCLLIHTEGKSCAHCKCSGLNVCLSVLSTVARIHFSPIRCLSLSQGLWWKCCSCLSQCVCLLLICTL